jgi:ubiquinone/menaquinone biosynthesis C-methylase UbiE
MLRERARGEEFLDRPDSDPRLTEQSFRFIRFVNHVGGGIRVVRKFLERELPKFPAGRTVKILDLGGGDCDIPLAITRWATGRGYSVQFTCIDHNAQVLAMAQESLARAQCETIRLEQTDIFTYEPPAEFDYALGSLVFHHFTADEIERLITRLRRFVRGALLINDLHRCALNYAVAAILTVRVDPELRHDALLSIQRGFKPAELARILSKHDPAPIVRRRWFCRVAGVVRFDREEGR